MAKKKQKVDIRAVCTGIVCLTLLEMVAMSLGFNGGLLRIVIMILALAIGVVIPNPFKK